MLLIRVLARRMRAVTVVRHGFVDPDDSDQRRTYDDRLN
jgi:hypothetical protein